VAVAGEQVAAVGDGSGVDDGVGGGQFVAGAEVGGGESGLGVELGDDAGFGEGDDGVCGVFTEFAGEPFC